MSLSTRVVLLTDIKKSNSVVRVHSPTQRKKARRLFERQGILSPIILDENLNIIDGSLRFDIALELGLRSLNCIILTGLVEWGLFIAPNTSS